MRRPVNSSEAGAPSSSILEAMVCACAGAAGMPKASADASAPAMTAVLIFMLLTAPCYPRLLVLVAVLDASRCGDAGRYRHDGFFLAVGDGGGFIRGVVCRTGSSGSCIRIR